MKKLITYTITSLFATIAISIAAPEEDAIMAKEKAAWQAFKDKKADDFKKLVSADLVAIYSDGFTNRQNELDTMSKREIKSFSLSDIKVVMPDPSIAVVSYKAKIDATTDGKDDSGNYNCGSVWHMKNGEWQAIFHTDMKEAAK